MGKMPTHKIELVEENEPGGLYSCSDGHPEIFFDVDPCTEEGCVRIIRENGGIRLVSCCPFDPAMSEEYARLYWTSNHHDSKVHYLEVKHGAESICEEMVSHFYVKSERCHHQFDCCGCWFQATNVRKVVKDGWTVYSKRFSKNV